MGAPTTIQRKLFLSLGKTGLILGAAALLLVVLLPRMTSEYVSTPVIDARTIVWFLMQLHLMFAAFVLGVPIFAMIVEIVGVATRNEKYDRLAREFTQLLAMAVLATAILGLLGLAGLIIFYPKFMTYLSGTFRPTLWLYAGTVFSNAILLVVYYYAWDSMQGRLKWFHIGIGALLNLSGTVLMCIANAWGTFMMSPAGVAEDSTLISLSEAIQNPLWWPINIHRLIANVAFGGSIAAAFAAVRYLLARTDEERAHYDWMGYVGNFVAMWALITLPFAGYWLGKEIYAYSAQMGTTLMGGAFSWLFIIQAVLIAGLFICANYYMWLGLGRIPGGKRYYRYVLGMEILIFVSMAVWMTPHTLVASLAEARRLGSAHHPLLGVLGLMSAKNTAANLAILTTFVSFVLYRRANLKREGRRPAGGLGAPIFLAILSLTPSLICGVHGFLGNGARAEARIEVLEEEVVELETQVLGSRRAVGSQLETLQVLGEKKRALEEARETPGVHHASGYRFLTVVFLAFLGLALLDMFVWRARIGDVLQWTVMGMAAAIVIYYGVKGYFVSAEVRIGYSVYQVMSVIFAMILVTALDLYLFFGAKSLGQVEWGKMPRRSQYVLVLLAVIFTLTIGLMGFVRAGIRETWHVYGVVRDTSRESFTPTMSYGVTVTTVTTLVFIGLLVAIFSLGMRKKAS